MALNRPNVTSAARDFGVDMQRRWNVMLIIHDVLKTQGEFCSNDDKGWRRWGEFFRRLCKRPPALRYSALVN